MTIADWIEFVGEDQAAMRGRGATIKLLPLTQFESFTYQMQMNRLRDLSMLDLVPLISINPPANGKTPPLWDEFTDTAAGLYLFDMAVWCDLMGAENTHHNNWSTLVGSAGIVIRFTYRRQLNRIRQLQGLPDLAIPYP